MSYITTFRGCFHFNKQPSNKLIKKINDFSKENHEDINCLAPMCHWIVCKDSKYRYKSLGVYHHMKENEITEAKVNIFESYEHQRAYLNQEYNKDIAEENQPYVLKWDGKDNFNEWYFWLRYVSEQFLSEENIHLTGLIEYQNQDGLIVGEKRKYINYYEDVYCITKQYFSKENNKNNLVWLGEKEIKKIWEENKEFFCKNIYETLKRKYKNYGFVEIDIFKDVEKICDLIEVYKKDELVWNRVSYCVNKEYEEFIGEPSHVWQNMWENEISRKWLKFIWCLDNNKEWDSNSDFEVDEFESTYEELGIEIDLDGCNSECDIMYRGECEFKDDIIEALRKRYRGKCGYIALDNWMRVSNEYKDTDEEDWNKCDYMNDEGSCVVWGSRDKR